jgi:small-conductance mechanosensitive channel
MRLHAKKILGVLLPMAVILISSHVPAQEPSQGDQTSGAKEELTAAAPDLADIVPLAAKLSGRLVDLENKVESGLDVSAVEKEYAGIEAKLKGLAGQLQQLKDSKDYQYTELVELRGAIEKENELFEKISKPLSEAIRQLGTWRKEWLAEKKRWNEWQSSLLEEGVLDPIKSTFAKANDTIETALNLVLPQLKAMLAVQEKAGNTQAKIEALAAELDALILVGRRGILIDASPPMLSSRYFSQFRSGLWYELKQGLHAISWPDSRFFARQGWIVFLQGFFSLVVIIAVYRNRQVLNESKRWRFLAARPFSVAFFLGIIGTGLFYEYGGAPEGLKLANTMVGGISFARLSGSLIETSWKRQFVYGLTTVFIITRLMYTVSLPLPLFRLYTGLTALVGLLFCLRWAGESVVHKDSPLYTWSLRLGSFLFGVIIIAELWGKGELALGLFISSIHSIAIVLPLVLYSQMIRGGLEWVFHGSPLRRVTPLHSDADAIIPRVALFIDVAIWVLLLAAILWIWGVYYSLGEAIKGLLALGFNLGSQRITTGSVIVSAGLVYGSFLLSRILEKLLTDEVLVRRRVEKGVRVSIGRLVHYIIIFIGFLLALLTLGFEFTQLTIMVSALGVGIGFGLQSVVNNFMSGLILLFERPVRVGDYIEFDGNWAEIKRIGLRATTVQTFDQADVIIPNAELVTHRVTNWTLSNRLVRIHIRVGVAYGSDVPLIMETLTACTKANSKVAKTPAPQVLFLSFGESSLDFDLRVWVLDADDMMNVISELHQEIDRRFREGKIEIAFPQRDLHLRSMDQSPILRAPENA